MTVNVEQYLYNGDGERVYVIKDGSLTGRRQAKRLIALVARALEG